VLAAAAPVDALGVLRVPGHLPTYSHWLADQDWTKPYRRHRRNLQLIGLPTPKSGGC
jgi:hypothetical protein